MNHYLGMKYLYVYDYTKPVSTVLINLSQISAIRPYRNEEGKEVGLYMLYFGKARGTPDVYIKENDYNRILQAWGLPPVSQS